MNNFKKINFQKFLELYSKFYSLYFKSTNLNSIKPSKKLLNFAFDN